MSALQVMDGAPQAIQPPRSPDRAGWPFTLNRYGTALPIELYWHTGRLLDIKDLRSYMRTCKTIHDACGALIYRTVYMGEANAQQRLRSLLYRLQPDATFHIRRPPILYLRTLRIKIFSPSFDDFRLLPLICDVLVGARQLQYLEIGEIEAELSAPFVSLLRRFGITRTPTSLAGAAFRDVTSTADHSPLTLPSLLCLRVACPKVLSAIASHRTLHAITLDKVVHRGSLFSFLEKASASPTSSSLRALTCTVSVEDIPSFVHAAADIFPHLTYLSLFVEASPPQSEVKTLNTTRVLLQTLANCPVLLPLLCVISVESHWCSCSLTHAKLEQVVRWATPVLYKRPGFRRLLFACVAISQEQEWGNWMVQEGSESERDLLGSCFLARSLIREH